MRREDQALVYLVRDDAGGLDKIILPIRGYGLWSTMYGFMALESDGNTVAGLGFYEHGETPVSVGKSTIPTGRRFGPASRFIRVTSGHSSSEGRGAHGFR
ncbi:MAG: hypothetical protein CM15mP103_10230 [Gammaproteobacteria bacterium]|nr:MAG: hypothetical protein CM15mP103_10230 [Gammaproteobacteria bacterium]